MEPVRSVHNPFVSYVQKLKKRKFRDQEGKFVIEGVRFVEEALASGWPVLGVAYCAEVLNNPRGARLVRESVARGARAVLVAGNVMSAMASTESPQGILALCGVSPLDLEGIPGKGPNAGSGNSILVVVDGVGDPGNLGTIVRSADAFGAGGVVITRGTVDLYNDKTLRSTMGSVFHLPVVQNVSPPDLRAYLKGRGMDLLMGVPEGGLPPDRIDLERPLALVVGGEAAGPSGEILSLPHTAVTIPMPGRAESLNAAVAASILIYEIARRRAGRD